VVADEGGHLDKHRGKCLPRGNPPMNPGQDRSWFDFVPSFCGEQPCDVTGKIYR
jgi:hypothetical protein